MDSLWTEYAGERYHVLGIEITDPELVTRTKKVIKCCFGLLAVLLIRTALLLLIDEPAGATILSLLFNLAIPAFGYLGARDGSSTLMCIFVTLMILNAANAIAVLFLVAYAYIAGLPQRDSVGGIHPFQMTPSVWVQVFLIAAWSVMALVAAFHANKLFNKLAQGDAIAERHNDDPEIGLPEINTALDVEPDSFGLPRRSVLQERVFEEEFNSPTRRKKGRSASGGSSVTSPRELRQMTPSE